MASYSLLITNASEFPIQTQLAAVAGDCVGDPSRDAIGSGVTEQGTVLPIRNTAD